MRRRGLELPGVYGVVAQLEGRRSVEALDLFTEIDEPVVIFIHSRDDEANSFVAIQSRHGHPLPRR